MFRFEIFTKKDRDRKFLDKKLVLFKNLKRILFENLFFL